MKSLIIYSKKACLLLGVTILLGAVLMPTSQVKAAANWWWATRYASQAPGGYVCKVGATSNGSPVRAQLTGISTSTRQRVYSYGGYVTAPNASYTGTLDIWSPVGTYSY
jgi:hypothetical protein